MRYVSVIRAAISYVVAADIEGRIGDIVLPQVGRFRGQIDKQVTEVTLQLCTSCTFVTIK